MRIRAANVLAVLATLAAVPAYGQVDRGDFIDEMRASVEQAKKQGAPLDRCTLGVQVGDNGRVLLSTTSAVSPGDTLRSVNGVSLEGSGPEKFVAILVKLPSTAVAEVEVVRNSSGSIQKIPCTSARSFTEPEAAARQAAARKDFAKCVSELQRIPAKWVGHWLYQYLAVNCASHAKSLSASEEPVRVHQWVNALVREAAFVRAERETAAKAVRGLEAYFTNRGRTDLHAELQRALSEMYRTAGEPEPKEPVWSKFRETAESQVRSRLVDPASAQFEWPFGFTYGTWKPLFGKRIEGYWTCGQVNAKNRMGGYTGATAFVVVMDNERATKYVEVGSGREFDLLASQCAKSTALLPPPPPALSAVASLPENRVSIADELEKLAGLRDRGVLTEDEFQAQKDAILGRANQPK